VTFLAHESLDQSGGQKGFGHVVLYYSVW
ncbi:hypothetical protein A2U01_0083374, partial [Trifolium medium]|nr:hypothetical protein [Trifolium medium]